MNPYYEERERKNNDLVACSVWAGVCILGFLIICFAVKGCYCLQVHP